jgi:hypothetical protein
MFLRFIAMAYRLMALRLSGLKKGAIRQAVPMNVLSV